MGNNKSRESDTPRRNNNDAINRNSSEEGRKRVKTFREWADVMRCCRDVSNIDPDDSARILAIQAGKSVVEVRENASEQLEVSMEIHERRGTKHGTDELPIRQPEVPVVQDEQHLLESMDLDSSLTQTNQDSADSASDPRMSFKRPENLDRLRAAEKDIRVERIPEPGLFFRDFAVADVLDFEQRAEDFHTLLKKPQPEDLYRSLYTLQCEQKAIDKLDATYKQKYGKALENAIKERFSMSKSKLEYALQLINKRTTPIDPLPLSSEEYKNAVPEMVYAALTPFKRNTNLLLKQFGTDLRPNLEQMGKPASEYALFLIGDQNKELKEISQYEFVRVSKAISQGTFIGTDDERRKIPFDYPQDGCKERAHLMCQTLKEMGWASSKIFAFSYYINEYRQKASNLGLETNLGLDAPLGQKPKVQWDDHVAMCVRVQIGSDIEEVVVDASLDPRVSTWPIEQWIDKITLPTPGARPAAAERISDQDLQNKMADEGKRDRNNGYPADKPYVITAGRHHYQLPLGSLSEDSTIPDQKASKTFGSFQLETYAKKVYHNRLASYIHEIGQSITSDENAADFIKNTKGKVPRGFSNSFFRLYNSFRENLISAGVSDSMANDVMDHLNGV